MTNIKSTDALLEELRYKIDETLRSHKEDRRTFHKDELNYQRKAYGGMSEVHETQAWQHTLGMLSSLLKIAMVGFDPDDSFTRTVTGMADFCQQTTHVAVKFSDSELSKFQGKLEELRDLLADGNKREDEIRRIIQEINQMLDQAIEKAHRAKSSPFLPG